MKICFVAHNLDYKNGYGRVAVTLINKLAQDGISGPIITFSNNEIPAAFANRTHAVLNHNPNAPLSNPLALYQDWQVIKKYSEDVDVVHFLTESFLATTIFGYNKPYIVTVYGTWAINPLNSNILSRFVFRYGYKHAKYIVAISRYTKSKLGSHISHDFLEVIYPGIDSSFSVKQQHNFENTNIRILSVGSLNPAKGYSVSIAAVAKLSKKYPKIIYTIISGRCNHEMEANLKDIARQHKFSNYIFKYQATDADLIQEYANSDLFLLTPVCISEDFEGFGLIFLEAMAAGLPVIASNSSAIPEIISHRINGLLAKEGDIEDTVKQLELIISNKLLRKKIISEGRSTYSRFSIEKMANKYLAIYNEVLQ